MLHWIDGFFLLLLFVAMPIYSAISYRRYLAQIAGGKPADRVALYDSSRIMHLLALLVLFGTWQILDRDAADVGLVMPDFTGLMIGAGLTTVILGLLLYAFYYAKKLDLAARAAQVESLGPLEHFLPQTDKELRSAYLVSISAGFAEEIVYRGFVLWCLVPFMPIWAALIVSSIGFGLAHSYQGVAGVLKTGGIGMFLGIVYVVTGTIWIPIVMHALLDILQMATARELFRAEPLAE